MGRDDFYGKTRAATSRRLRRWNYRIATAISATTVAVRKRQDIYFASESNNILALMSLCSHAPCLPLMQVLQNSGEMGNFAVYFAYELHAAYFHHSQRCSAPDTALRGVGNGQQAVRRAKARRLRHRRGVELYVARHRLELHRRVWRDMRSGVVVGCVCRCRDHAPWSRGHRRVSP